jgi:hypothetical protein
LRVRKTDYTDFTDPPDHHAGGRIIRSRPQPVIVLRHEEEEKAEENRMSRMSPTLDHASSVVFRLFYDP